MQAFQAFLAAMKPDWLLSPLAILVVNGRDRLLAAWFIGPAMGLGVVAHQGNMPPMFASHNKRALPTRRVDPASGDRNGHLAALYVFIPESATALLDHVGHDRDPVVHRLSCSIFAALIKLRCSQPDVKRAFKIPGGMVGVWIVGGLGFLATALTFVISMLPIGGNPHVGPLYVVIMVVGTAVLALPPLVFLKFKKPVGSRPARKPCKRDKRI